MKTAESRKEIKVYIEMIRIIAMILVIYNHLPGYLMFVNTEGIKQAVYMYLTMVTRINVPLFFMISGALLLRKEEDYPVVLRKRVLRLLIVIILFNGLLLLYQALAVGTEGMSFHKIVRQMMAGKVWGSGSYWFMYAYLGMLLTLPFLQRIAAGMKKTDFAVLTVLRFLLESLLPVVNLFLAFHGMKALRPAGKFSIPFITISAFFYPLAGYYLDEHVDIRKMKKKHIFFLIITATAGILISCRCTYREAVFSGEFSQNYVHLFDYVSAFAAFLLIKYLMEVKYPRLSEGKVRDMICFAGSLTFGIYLVNPFLKLLFFETFKVHTVSVLRGQLLSFVWILISVPVCGVITYLLKKLPGFRKLL